MSHEHESEEWWSGEARSEDQGSGRHQPRQIQRIDSGSTSDATTARWYEAFETRTAASQPTCRQSRRLRCGSTHGRAASSELTRRSECSNPSETKPRPTREHLQPFFFLCSARCAAFSRKRRSEPGGLRSVFSALIERPLWPRGRSRVFLRAHGLHAPGNGGHHLLELTLSSLKASHLYHAPDSTKIFEEFEKFMQMLRRVLLEGRRGSQDGISWQGPSCRTGACARRTATICRTSMDRSTGTVLRQIMEGLRKPCGWRS